jgi:two-component system phosphate regulon response regulator PhoB
MTVSPNKKILIVEDEPDVVDLLTLQLRKADGFSAIVAHDGAEGLKKARTEAPALIVLDLMLPRMSGLEVCKLLRTDSLTSHIPIIMLTAKAEEVDRIVGLEFGADDYVTKPFSPRELLLRIKAILRRGPGELADGKITRGPITIDAARHRGRVRRLQVRRAGQRAVDDGLQRGDADAGIGGSAARTGSRSRNW